MSRNKQKQFHKYFSNLLAWKKINHKFDQNRKKSDIVNYLLFIYLDVLLMKS